MADWSTMPKELVCKIGEHIEFYEDFESFQWVCSSWRLAAKKARFRAYINNINKSSMPHDHTLPWLMLPARDMSPNSLRFYSLSKGKIRLVTLPDSSSPYENLMLSSHGWLLLVRSSVQLCLFNPFTRAIIELPDKPEIIFMYKFILSANPSTTSDFVVFLSVFLEQQLFFWSNGDDDWTEVEDKLNWPMTPFLESICLDISFYQGEFYGINMDGKIAKFKTALGTPHLKEVAECGISWKQEEETWLYYLVESGGQLLVVRQVVMPDWNLNKNIDSCFTKRFDVYKLLFTEENYLELEEVQSLGNRAIFIGSNSSFSMEVSPAHGFKPNCIYFFKYSGSFDFEWMIWACCGEGNTWLYNLTDGKIERFYNGPSKDTPIIWVESPILLNH